MGKGKTASPRREIAYARERGKLVMFLGEPRPQDIEKK
jgi:hypothetical protein